MYSFGARFREVSSYIGLCVAALAIGLHLTMPSSSVGDVIQVLLTVLGTAGFLVPDSKVLGDLQLLEADGVKLWTDGVNLYRDVKAEIPPPPPPATPPVALGLILFIGMVLLIAGCTAVQEKTADKYCADYHAIAPKLESIPDVDLPALGIDLVCDALDAYVARDPSTPLWLAKNVTSLQLKLPKTAP